MKVLASLLRVVFSILVLLALACYMQSVPTVSLNDFYNSLDQNQILNMLSGFNAVTVSMGVILLLGIFSFTRVLEAAWNVVFCASILVLLALGLYTLCGPVFALPQALCHNPTVNQICQTSASNEVPIAIITFVFLAGWICASACGRVAITAVVSYGLWYGLTALFTYAVHLWGSSENPAMPEALSMMQSTPWVIAAVPGAFFLIYALFMAFFETFISTKRVKSEPTPAKEDKKTEDKQETTQKPLVNKEPAKEEKKAEEKKPEEKKPEPVKKPVLKPVEPASKTQPVLKVAPITPSPLKKLKPAAPADSAKTEEQPKEEPRSAEKPKEEPEAETEKPEAEVKPETKAEDKPEVKEEPKPESAAAPKEEAKPAEDAESAPEKKVEEASVSKEATENKEETKS